MILRFSNRHFHRRNLRLGSTGSLSVDRLGSGEHCLHLRLHRQKSDSNNSASAEASSESINRYCKMLISNNVQPSDNEQTV